MATHTKYLRMHIDDKLRWHIHIKEKCKEINNRAKKMYWLLNPDSTLSLNSKRLLYNTMNKPIWTYGKELWSCAGKSNIVRIQRRQNLPLRTIVNAYRHTTNDVIHQDLRMNTVTDEISQVLTPRLSKSDSS